MFNFVVNGVDRKIVVKIDPPGERIIYPVIRFPAFYDNVFQL